MNGGKQDLERARLQHMLERSCWVNNNEKNKLDMILWNTSQIMRRQPATHEKRLYWYEQGDKKLIRRKDKRRTWIIYNHHK